MLKRAIALLLLLVASRLPAQATDTTPPRLYVRQAGPGEPGQVLSGTLARPYTLIRPGMGKARLPRDSIFDRSVIVLGADADVASTVHGDLVVIGGDLFLHPGASISGRVIAVGGSVYSSALANVGGASLSFPDVTFDAIGTPSGIALDYRGGAAPVGPPMFSLPFGYGFKVPQYTRVDGLAVGWGPRIVLGAERVTLEPALTYRSDIGAFDLSLDGAMRLGRGYSLLASASRDTRSNDGWIRSDATNSLTTIFGGHDYRNYFRADRFEGRVQREITTIASHLTLSAGARTERDWSVRAGGPWSLTGYDAGDGIIRPNPPVFRGRLSSALAAAQEEWNGDRVQLTGSVQLEVPFQTPADHRFVQGTVDFGMNMPTVASQSVTIRTHAVVTAGDTAPPQRWSYLGGTGSLPTFGILQFGGDELLFVEGDYNIPIEPLTIPLLGPPTIMLQYMVGSAGVQHLPSLQQNIGLGLRVALRSLWVSYTFNPKNGDHKFAAGLAVQRFP
ncbi:MAG TPA: hypothetical protein VFW98_06750 [Gemmatimonadaceae bacterium]|nr:hypothetical protein [Gemmatimonadaceae bacterium]